MNSRKQRRRTATTDKGADALDRRPQRSYHEAAHAVVARKLGQSCIGIMMFPTDPQSNACALTGSAAYHSGGTVDERISIGNKAYRKHCI
jgi:hypothetical protein